MATSNVFLTLVSGVKTLVSSISSFTGSANEIVSTNGSGFIDPSLLPPGVGAKTYTMTADGNLTAGMFVNIFDDSSVLSARPADESLGFPANGFVLDPILDNATGTVYASGVNTALAGLTPGQTYWLDVSGGVATSPSLTEQGFTQEIGVALSATELCLANPGVGCVIDLL